MFIEKTCTGVSKEWVNSNQSSNFWQVEIRCYEAGAGARRATVERIAWVTKTFQIISSRWRRENLLGVYRLECRGCAAPFRPRIGRKRIWKWRRRRKLQIRVSMPGKAFSFVSCHQS